MTHWRSKLRTIETPMLRIPPTSWTGVPQHTLDLGFLSWVKVLAAVALHTLGQIFSVLPSGKARRNLMTTGSLPY